MSTPRLLIVDDSRAQRFILRRCLEGQDVEIVGEAADGREATEKFQHLRPDVVLLDLVMPEMDGHEALDHILTFDPNARVVIASSVGSEETVRACLSRGAISFLQKPFATEALLRVIQEAASGASEAVCRR